MAQIVIEPGENLVLTPFSVETVNAVPRFATPGIPGFEGFLYGLVNFSSGPGIELHEFTEGGVPSLIQTWQLDFARLSFGTGAFAGRAFAAEFGLPSGLAPDGVYEVSPALSLSTFSDVGGGNPNPNCMTFGSGAFGASAILACPGVGSIDPSFDDAVVRLSTDGGLIDTLHQDPRSPAWVAISPNSAYGEFVYCGYLDAPEIDRISPSGVAAPFADVAPDLSSVNFYLSFEFGQGGALGEFLYVTVGTAERELLRILPDGQVQRVATGVHGITFDHTSGDAIVISSTNDLFWLRPPTSCGASSYGIDATPAVNTLELTYGGDTAVGSTFTAVCKGASSGSPAFTAVGVAPASLPLLGGTLLVSPQGALILGAQATGSGSLHYTSLEIPATPTLAHASLYIQCFALDNSAPGGVWMSNGLHLEICP